MSKAVFSSGISKLDSYIGGFRFGDVVLWMIEKQNSIEPLFRACSDYCAAHGITVSGLLPPACAGRQAGKRLGFLKSDSVETFQPQHTANGRSAFLKKTRTYLNQLPRNSVLFLDDLSIWSSAFRSNTSLLQFFDICVQSAKDRGISIVASVPRSGLSEKTILELQEKASVVLDAIGREEELFVVPVKTNQRYVPYRMFPLRLDLQNLNSRKGSQVAFQNEEEVQQESERAFERIRSDIFSSDQRFSNLFNGSFEPMALFHRSSGFREFNRRFAEVMGYEESDLRSLPFSKLLAPGCRVTALRILAEPPKKARTVELSLLRENGKPLPVELVISPLKEGWYLCALHDISRKRRQEEEAREAQSLLIDQIKQEERDLRLLVETIPDSVAVFVDNNLVFHNSAFVRNIRPSTDSNLLGKPWTDFFQKSSHAPIKKEINQIRRESQVDERCLDAEMLRPDGSSFSANLFFSELIYGGRKAIRMLFRDVSASRQLVRELDTSKDRFKRMFEQSTLPLILIEDGHIAIANQAYADLLGEKNPDALHNRSLLDFIEKSSLKEVKSAIDNVSEKKSGIQTLLVLARRSDGTTFDLELTIRNFSKDGRQSIMAELRDSSHRLAVERELGVRTEELSILEEIASSLSTGAEFHRLLARSVQRTADCLGFDVGCVHLRNEEGREFVLQAQHKLPEKIAGKLASIPLREGLGGLASKTFEAHQFYIDKYPGFLPHRPLFAEAKLHTICIVPLFARNEVIGLMMLFAKDQVKDWVSGRRLLTLIGNGLGGAIERTELLGEVSNAVERYQQVVETIDQILFDRLPDGRCLSISPNVQKILGYKPEDFRRRPTFWLGLTHPEDKAEFMRFLANLNEADAEVTIEYRLLPRGKAEYLWFRERIKVERDETGGVTALRGVLTEITTLRDMKQSTGLAEKQRASVLGSIHEGVAIFDKSFLCTEWNEAMAGIFGRQKSSALGQSGLELLGQIEGFDPQKMFDQARTGKVATSDELSLQIAQAGDHRYIWIRMSPHLQGEVGGDIICVVMDVTEQHVIQESARETEQVLRNVIDTMGDSLVLTDLQGVVLDVNREFLRLLGYKRSQVLGSEFPYPWLVDDEMGRFVLWISSLREKSYLRDFDMTWQTVDGRTIPMSLTTTLLRNSYGEPIAMLNLARDISDRKKLTAQLEERTLRLELINKLVSRASETLDLGDVFETIAVELEKVVAFDQINIGLLPPDGNVLEVYTKDTNEISDTRYAQLSLDRTVSQLALDSQGSVIIQDFQAEEQYANLLSAMEGFRSQITLPVAAKGRVLGTLSLISKEPNKFGNHEKELLTPLAQQLATVIERMLLFKQVTEDAQYIHNILDSIGSAVYTIDEKRIVRESNKSWHEVINKLGKGETSVRAGVSFLDTLPGETLPKDFATVVDRLFDGTLEEYSGEFSHKINAHQLHFHVTANPLVIEGKVTGVVFVYTDITDLKRTEQELKERNRQLLLLSEISSSISAAEDIQQMFTSVIPRLSNIIGADGSLVYLAEEDSGELVLEEEYGVSIAGIQLPHRLPVDQTATGMALISRKALFIESGITQDARVHEPNRSVFHQRGYEAMAAIPLRTKDRVLGVMDVLYKKAHSFSEAEQQLLSLVGNQLGAAIENVRLYARLREQFDVLTVLYTMSQELTATLDSDHIMRSIYRQVRKIIPVQSFRIQLLEETQKMIVRTFVADTSNPEGHFANELYKVEELSIEDRILTTRKSVMNSPVLEGTEAHHLLAVPIISDQQMLGMITCTTGGPIGYSVSQLRLLESIANLGAIALEKAKLYAETVEKSNEIQRRNKELDDFTYVVSHDLKEPLITIEGYSRMLMKEFSETLGSEGQMYMETVAHSSARMKRLIEDLLQLSRVGRLVESITELNTTSIIDGVLTEMDYMIKERNAEITVSDELPSILGNETYIQAVFKNLIANGLRFNTSNRPQIEIGCVGTEKGKAILFVRDNGIGIEKEFCERIFLIFQRLHTHDQYGGTGAGLAIVKKIIEMHHGHIWVESEPGKGSTFFFTIPTGKQIGV